MELAVAQYKLSPDGNAEIEKWLILKKLLREMLNQDGVVFLSCSPKAL